MLAGNKKHTGRENKNQSVCLYQELTNIVMSKIALKALEGDSKRHCQKGYDLEKTYASNLMRDSFIDEFPFGKIKLMAEVDLVQKSYKTHVKD